MNIISGLLIHQKENLYDDNLIRSENLRDWQKNVAIVPQTVFLMMHHIREHSIAIDKKY